MIMIKPVAIITFHASHNCGSMLQVYALQHFLQQIGETPIILNYRSFAQRYVYISPSKFLYKRRVVNYVLHPILAYRNILKWRRFEAFLNKYMRLSQQCNSLDGVNNIINEISPKAIIAGGDQIWNTSNEDFSMAYFLPFRIDGVRKIAYSPSVGGAKCNILSSSNCIPMLLSDFDNLSVREESASVLFSKYLEREVPAVIDPVFLLDKAHYSKLAQEKPLITGSYLYCYSLSCDEEIIQIAKSYAKQHHLKLVLSCGEKSVSGCINYVHTGPIEFLNLMKNATVVCGRSYHLIAFSLIFEKPFFVINGQSDDRMMNILNYVGLENLCVSSSENTEKIFVSDINWESIRCIINKKRNFAFSYLTNALSGTND